MTKEKNDISKDSINNLEVSSIIKSRLRNANIETIGELEDVLANNTKIKFVGVSTRVVLSKAIDSYKEYNNHTLLVKTTDSNEEKNEDNTKVMRKDIKTKKKTPVDKPSKQTKPSVNRYDIANMMLEIVVNLCNDKNYPKYRMQKFPKFPSYNLFYDEQFIYVRVDYINELLELKLEDYEVLSSKNIQNDKPIFMAISCMRYNTPLVTTTSKGKIYCTSGYAGILSIPDKYIKFDISKLEDKENVTIDLTMNDSLIEEWVQFKKNVESEALTKLENDNDSEWVDYRSLCDVWVMEKKFDDAVKVIIEYADKYYKANNTYVGISNEAIAKLKDYQFNVKDNKLSHDLSNLIRNIDYETSDRRKYISTSDEERLEDSKSIRTLEEVLEKDLSKLPEDIRDDIMDEVLDDDEEEDPKPNTTKKEDINHKDNPNSDHLVEFKITTIGVKTMGSMKFIGFFIAELANNHGPDDYDYTYTTGVAIISNNNLDTMDIKLDTDNLKATTARVKGILEEYLSSK